MKIGIFTFHVAHNYGAVLQAFALQHKLRELSHDVEFVNYKPAYLTKPYGIFPTDIIFSENPKAILKKLINYTATIHKNLARRRAFNKFIDERLQVGPQLDDGVAGTYDAYVFGSDQIWNFNMTGGFDDIYFGRSPVEKYPMSKKFDLLKNTMIIGVGKVATQFISFLLLPVYTLTAHSAILLGTNGTE